MTEGLKVWTVYERPTDYPEGYVARMWLVNGAVSPDPIHTDFTIFGTLPEIRRYFERWGFTRMDRQPEDEPQVLETWL